MGSAADVTYTDTARVHISGCMFRLELSGATVHVSDGFLREAVEIAVLEAAVRMLSEVAKELRARQKGGES